MNTSIEEKLFRIKEQIELAKTDKSIYEGKLAVQMERLKELGCDSVESANEKLKALQLEIDKLEKEISVGLTKFEKEFGF